MTEEKGASAQSEKPYGKCQDCDLDLVDRDTVNAHQRDTMAPTGEAGVTARSHRVSIVNPTEEERRASRVRNRIGDALLSVYEDLCDRVGRGDFTTDEVAEGLRWFDLGDGWDEHIDEAQS